MTLLTQHEIETRMYRGGIDRATAMMSKAEENDNAARNPYAATIFRDFVLPLAEVIRNDAASQQANRYKAHTELLLPLDADAVAYLSIRTLLNCLMNPTKGAPTLRQVATSIGTTVHQELVLAQIEHLNPELYHTLANDFNRRRSKNVRHRLTVFKMQASKAGIEWAEWGPGARDQVGSYLLEQCARLGLCEIDEPPRRADGSKMPGKRTIPLEVRLTPDVIETIDRIKGFVSITSPLYGPCVEPPRDWQGMTGGGFHTPAMQRVHPYLVKAHASARELLRTHEMPVVVRAVNHIQKTAWRVNRRVLEACIAVAQQGDAGEIVSTVEIPSPPPPAWLAQETDPAARGPYREAEFKQWKRDMSEWYTQRKLRGTKIGRFQSAIKAAQFFREYPALFFVYFLDSRGRVYPLTYGLNPQGSDLQKSLLQFAEGKPLHTPDAIKWFLIQGANKWGYDKAKLKDREAWAGQHAQMILDIAADPVSNRDWEKADSPLQFLAWCFEFQEWQRRGDDFESRLPISMDGSCNGLQHFSAMLRDEVGGRATNLTDNEDMQDIYRIVAEATKVRLAADSGNPLVAKWLAHGIDRSLVKRSVMTTPYGVTQRSAVGYVVEDYLKAGKAQGVFENGEYYAAAQAVMNHAWKAISDVVVKSREAMDWLKSSATKIIKTRGDSTEGVISWVTPSGFLATQSYYELEEHRVHTWLHGMTKVKVVSESESASVHRHASGLAPNFVHSCDASHLHLVAAAAEQLGIDALAMIHDDYGTHAADAQKLYTLIRVQFVEMYTNHDPIEDFAKLYPEAGKPPSKGQLDLSEVIYSDYFFS